MKMTEKRKIFIFRAWIIKINNKFLYYMIIVKFVNIEFRYESMYNILF